MVNPVPVYIGNQSSAATLMEPFEYAVANGFDAFEWFPDKQPSRGWDEQDLSPGLRSEIRETARSRGIRLSVHAPWTIDLASPESGPPLRQAMILAEDLGAAVLIVHLYLERGIPAYARSLLPVLRWAVAQGLRVAIENTVQTSPGDFNALFAALRALHQPGLARAGMCLDLGHANLYAATRNDYLSYIDQLNEDVPIIHLHVHENWGDADSHLPLFTGPAAHDDSGVRGFIERMKKRGFSGSVILEQWPQPPSLLNAARAALLRAWNDNKAEIPKIIQTV